MRHPPISHNVTRWVAIGLLCAPPMAACGSADAKRTVQRDGTAGEGGTGSGGVDAAQDGGSAGSAARADGGGGVQLEGGEGGSLGGATTNAGAAGLNPAGSGAGGGASGEAASGGEAGAGAFTVPASGFEDDFEAELQTDELYSIDHPDFEQWNVVSGSLDVTRLPNEFIESPGGYGSGPPAAGAVVDLNGSSSQEGVLETKHELEFLAGVNYTLRYALGNARAEANSMTVSIPGLLSRTRSHDTVAAFASYEETFKPVTTLTARLRFTSHGNADFDGLLLDHVSILGD
jgi:hypothetical protein